MISLPHITSLFTLRLRRLFSILAFTIPSSIASADAWADRDGKSLVAIKSLELTMVSIGEFNYFDRIFSQLQTDNARLNLCFGYKSTSGKPTACIEDIRAVGLSYANEQIRTITLNTREYSFFTALTEGALRAGAEIVVSIDNNQIYASCTLQRNFKLSNESLGIILGNNEGIAVPNLLRDLLSI